MASGVVRRAVPLTNGNVLTTWYAGDRTDDVTWAVAMALGTDTWKGEMALPLERAP